jgi:Zn-dependent protease/CBS domain-containing protein
MNGSGFRIGRLYGISIRMDWSWLLIMLLISWNLAFAFGQLHPDWNNGMRWGIALLGALLFFASVLAHELAHSLVAKSQGLPVRNITLFLFGGVSNIQREPSRPRDEFIMAAAGPVTSLVIGALMRLSAAGRLAAARRAGTILQVAGNLSPLATVLLWIGTINLILGVFNLIPGFPLDGGRVLRSIIWALTNNLRTATRYAAFTGQAIAWLMIVAGIAMAFGLRLPLFGTGLLNGLWLAFIGWFLNSASAQSSQQVAIQEVLEGVPVARLMRTNPPTVEPDCTITDIVHTHIMGHDDQAFPVLENEQLVGIVSLDDVRRVPKEEWDAKHVSDIMTPAPNLVTVAPEADASQAMETLIQRDVRQLPVVRNNPVTGQQFLGLLRRRDIMQWLQIHTGNHSDGRRTP